MVLLIMTEPRVQLSTNLPIH